MLTLKAPAKINWFLFVLGKRPDGFHDISSLMQCVSLYDTLSFEESAEIEVITDSPIPVQENLVFKAAILLKKISPSPAGARITLKKEIPLSSGMGGGSSDAACALLGLNRLWGLKLDKERLSLIAASLGSDVPFFLNGPAALVEGRGERVRPTSLRRSYSLLLLKPDFGVSTRQAYSEAANGKDREIGVDDFIRAVDSGDFKSVSLACGNDLEPAVIKRHPEIGELKERLREGGALFSAMSGSGSMVFGVFEDEITASGFGNSIPAVWSRAVKTLPSS